ncbi:MAG: cytidylate kinase family protein [Treponema sp.]|nr:cytidylate kinase family protein [Treponema sp.]
MAIITISRELAALGDEIAHELAELTGYRFVDKQALENRITSYGFNSEKLEKYDEKKPAFWASLSRDRDDYIHYLKSALLAEAELGPCIFVGRGANAVFKDIPGCIFIRLVAPLAIRIERVKSYFRCDEKRAKQIIEQSDKDRSAFHRYFFDIDWANPVHYHLVLNTGFVHPASAAEEIRHLVSLMVTPDTEAQLKTRLQSLSLGQKVIHHILYTLAIPIHFLEASCIGDTVVLRGVANSQSAVEAAVAGAQQVPGVSHVQSEIQVVQEYSVMP